MLKVRHGFDPENLLAIAEKAAREFTPPPPLHYDPLPSRRPFKFLYLSVEVAARELNGKVKLASEMAKRGWQVLVGASWLLNDNQYSDLPPGVVLFKTLNALDAHLIHAAQKNGHLTVALGEEMYGLAPEKRWYEANAHPDALKAIDLICVHSEEAASLLREMTDSAKVVVTGNPRAVTNVKQVNDEILCCFMAGNINSVIPFEQYVQSAFRALGRNTGPSKDIITEQIKHEAECHPLMVQAVNALAEAFPDKTIRVRPHPVEDWSLYDCSGNVKLDQRSSFSWSMSNAACVVFTSGCGTGFEAYLAGVPSVRIGTGGVGASRNLGTFGPDICAQVRDCLSQQHRYSPAADDPSDPRLADAIGKIFAEYNGRQMKYSLINCWRGQKHNFQPQAFHMNKFPRVKTEDIEKFANHKATAVDWNLWVIEP